MSARISPFVKALLNLLLLLLQVFVLAFLPFVLLIRGSVWLYEGFSAPTWLALAGGMAGAFMLLFFYVVFIYGVIFLKLSKRGLKIKAGLVLLLLVTYCTFTLVNFGRAHAKTDEVRKEFRSLHPFLRIGVGTFLLLDRQLLVTDFSRTHEDYRKMGLPAKNRSLHYPQSDGYVHAMDLRTNGRHAIRNGLMKFYFRLMGFKTLRHVGTADHLHVSLPPHDFPQAR